VSILKRLATQPWDVRWGFETASKDILKDYEFRIEVKEDMFMARLEGHELDFMKKRLAILGYLTLHTRQLDMIMENEASLAYYRSKLKKDIQTLLNGR